MSLPNILLGLIFCSMLIFADFVLAFHWSLTHLKDENQVRAVRNFVPQWKNELEQRKMMVKRVVWDLQAGVSNQ